MRHACRKGASPSRNSIIFVPMPSHHNSNLEEKQTRYTAKDGGKERGQRRARSYSTQYRGQRKLGTPSGTV